MSQEETSPAETPAPFEPSLSALIPSAADMRQMVPPDLRPDRSGILYAYYAVAWLNLNNKGGRSAIDLLDHGQLRLGGNYDFEHLGRSGRGSFLFHPKIERGGSCQVLVKIAGTLSFEMNQKGRYEASPGSRYIEYICDDGTRIRQQAHSANLLWYPSITIDIQTKESLYQLKWENRPA